MWQQLLASGLLKDLGIFAGAYAGIQVANRLHTPEVDPIFEAYPYVQAFGYVPLLTQITTLEQPALHRDLLRVIEGFLQAATTGNVRVDGFRVNRQANDILRRLKHLVDSSKRSPNDTVALAAMDFERDDMPVVEGMVNNTVRNMLLAD
tara:strand:+ start:2074 stop:2520 length:447 start_codon:yes stop_codon:yes gene_type:complete